MLEAVEGMNVEQPRQRVGWRWGWGQLYGLGLLVYLGALWFTDAHFMGDTIWYAEHIEEGRTLWDAGHLLWRPLGGLVARITPLLGSVGQLDPHTNIVQSLIVINLITGAVAVYALIGWLRRICNNPWIIGGVTLAFMFSQGFLNYTQTGSSYGAGLAMLVLGMYLLSRASTSERLTASTALLAGVSLAAAVCVWLPYVLTIPAALVSPLLLFGRDSRRARLMLLAGAACGALILAAYLTVAWQLGISNVAEFKSWILATSRGNTTGGWFRMGLGFARSFINIERDGVLFKRFLLHDPYNPVTLWQLVQLSAYKIALFYVCLVALLIALLRSPGGRWVAGLVTIAAIPALAFAVIWQGGDMERYLALYPALCVAFAYALAQPRALPPLKYVAALFLIVEVLTNSQAMATTTLNYVQAQATTRIESVVETMQPNSLLVTLNQQDGVWYFNHSFPLHPINRRNAEFTYSLSGRNDWQQKLAARVERAWAAGGDVWISRRMLSDRPGADWAWVESDTQAVQWYELYAFFSRLDQRQVLGGADGFVLLAPSMLNKQLLGLAPPNQLDRGGRPTRAGRAQ